MKTHLSTRLIARRVMTIGGIILVATLFAPNVCVADHATIYKIEEDWELVVNEPDPVSISPQISFFTSPGSSESDYFQLQMNYSVDADFSPGGFHVAAITNDRVTDETRSTTRRVLRSGDDHIRWTNAMAVIHGKFFFAVKDGYGNEWGAFGGPEYLVKMSAGATHDLSGYHPQRSLDAVDIGFGANRVESLTLVEVRVYYTNGNTITVPVNRSP